MRYAPLPAAASPLPQQLSVLGFGGAPLMGRVGRKASLAALDAAFAAGITLFDTARSYGYGESEGILGEFLAGRRDQVVLCTKFGILPADRGGWKRKLKPVAQAAIGVFPQLRQLARRGATGQLVPRQFTPQVLQASLETSLRALRTDFIDLLLVHDADPSVLSNQGLLDALQALKARGIIRMAGVSGGPELLSAVVAARPPVLSAVQFPMDPSRLHLAELTTRPEARGLLLLANHPFGGADGVAALQQRIRSLAQQPQLPAALREKLAGDPSTLMPEIVFGAILAGTHIASVIAAMTSLGNLRRNVDAIERCRFSPEELQLLRAELAVPPGGPPTAAPAPSA
jgi:aryl-alcohol dehydrogenase-like predicted oxidoreductase